jgi:hypothetical protein
MQPDADHFQPAALGSVESAKQIFSPLLVGEEVRIEYEDCL